MAHGNNILCECRDCKKAILILRFHSSLPICECGKTAEYTNKDKLRKNYNLSILFDFNNIGYKWVSIEELKKL